MSFFQPAQRGTAEAQRARLVDQWPANRKQDLNKDNTDTYRDDGEDSIDDAGSDGGIDGLRDTSTFKYACRVVENLEKITVVIVEEALFKLIKHGHLRESSPVVHEDVQ